MDTRLTKRNLDQEETEPVESEEGEQNKSVIYRMMETQIRMLEEQREMNGMQEERFHRVINDLEAKLNETAKRQTNIEDTQERLGDTLSNICERIENIEQRAGLWDSLDERASEVHAKLLSEMHADLRTELMGALQRSMDDLKIQICHERRQHTEIIHKSVGDQPPSATANIVDQTTGYKNMQKGNVCFNEQLDTPRGSSTPRLSLRRGVEAFINASDQFKSPRFMTVKCHGSHT